MVLQDTDEINVLFVDFGTLEVVTLEDIRPIESRFLEMPIQAIKCTLSGKNVVCFSERGPLIMDSSVNFVAYF